MNLQQADALLASMFEPLPLDTFLDEVLSRKFLKLEASACGAPRHLLLGEDPRATLLNAYAAIALRMGCHALAPSGPPPAIGEIPNATAFKAKIDEYQALGYTVRLHDVARLTHNLALFMRALEFHFQVKMDAQVFWSRGDARAPIHFDDFDIIAVQLIGRKKWHITTDPSELPNAWRSMYSAPPRMERHQEVDVGPGDLLYLPRGTMHSVEAQSESVHVSIGFVPITLRDVLIACIDHLSDLKRPLREHAIARPSLQVKEILESSLGAEVAGAAQDLAKVCADREFIADAMERRSSRYMGGLQKLTPGVPGALALSTRVRHTPYAISHLSGSPERIDFAYPGGNQYVQRAVEPSLVFISRTPEFRIGEIVGDVDGDVKLAIVKKFIETGFLEVVV